MSLFRRCRTCGKENIPTDVRRCPKCTGNSIAWAYRVVVVREGDVKTQRRGSGFPTRAAAARAERETITAIEQGEYVERDSARLGRWLTDKWLPAVRNGRIRENTYRTYADAVRCHINPHIGHVPVQRLRAEHVIAMRDALLSHGRADGKGGLHPRTVEHAMVVLGRAMRHAVVTGLIRVNPVVGVEKPENHEEDEPPAVWTYEQIKVFLRHTAGTDRHVLWQVAASTGMRRSELAALKWEKVDLDAGRLRVDRARVVASGGEVIEGPPKTRKSRRWVALDARTVLELRRHRLQCAMWAEAAGDAWEDTGYVFVDRLGRPLHPERISKWFAKAVADSGLPRLGLHGLRHSWATLAFAAGVPTSAASQRLGHSSTQVTRDIYQHVSAEVAGDAAETVAGLIFDPADEPGEDGDY